MREKQSIPTSSGMEARFVRPGKAGFAMWSGGHFVRYGRDIGAERLAKLVRRAYSSGTRTFMTADVFGEGEADRLLGAALTGFDRSSYCLIGAIGHDFYKGTRMPERGYPRFTEPNLRSPHEYGPFLQMAAEKSLERLNSDYFDILLLHNPDSTGFMHESVWNGMRALRESGMACHIGIAPGPGNGFALDLIAAFERFDEVIEWAMIQLCPIEPWPGEFVIPAAVHHNVNLLARGVEGYGMFHDTLRPGARFLRDDYRNFRPPGWIESAQEKMERFRKIGVKYNLTLLQLASEWALAHQGIQTVVPTLIQEAEEGKLIEAQADELSGLTLAKPLPHEIVDEISRLGDNKNSIPLMGASPQYIGPPVADQWPITSELLEVAGRWGILPDRDLYCPDDPRDIREYGIAVDGIPQAANRRLYFQLHVFSNCEDMPPLMESLQNSGLEGVLYRDLNDPTGIALLLVAESADVLVGSARTMIAGGPFSFLPRKHELTMIGRTFSTGHELDLAEAMLGRPRRIIFNSDWPWAIWYPVRYKPEFGMLPRDEQARVLSDLGRIERNYAQSGYANEIRLASDGLDRNNNEFCIGLVGPDLYPLSRFMQEFRKSEFAVRFIDSMGPIFTGRACWHSKGKRQQNA